jgi:hypothetical protein
MAALGNLIWFIFCGGLWMGLGWILAGCILYVTIIGIPFGQACFRIASFAFFPFGKELVDARALGESRIVGRVGEASGSTRSRGTERRRRRRITHYAQRAVPFMTESRTKLASRGPYTLHDWLG